MSAIRLWLLIVAALICLTLVIGGATRLTGSGLSIVEWQPVTGVWPPTTETAWETEFDKYKTIPQYREHNASMTLGQFKTIYSWEWTHRMLARVVGVVFLLPFLWFLSRGNIERRLRARLWSIFGLGAALGAIGWWMVSSGLADRISVSQYRLAFHLTLACIVFAAVLSTAERLTGRTQPDLAAAGAGQRSRAPLSRPRSDLSGRAGGRVARRAHLQHLAAHRWRACAREFAPFFPESRMAKFF